MIWFMKPTLQVPPQVIRWVRAKRATSLPEYLNSPQWKTRSQGTKTLSKITMAVSRLSEDRVAQFLRIISQIPLRRIRGNIGRHR